MTLRQIGAYINRMHAGGRHRCADERRRERQRRPGLYRGQRPHLRHGGDADLRRRWWISGASLTPYELNTLLVRRRDGEACSSSRSSRTGTTGLNFQGTGKLVTPLGATLLRTSALPAGTIIGLDKQLCAGDGAGPATCWWSTTSSSTASWSGRPSPPSPALRKIFQDATKVLKLGG